jgi:GAF domain-containing protein/HAMP domain-containing protein
MDQNSQLPDDTTAANERLARTYYARARFTPLLLGISGLGFLAIYLLSRFGILGEPAPQLLYIGGVTFLFALAEIPILALAQEKRGISASLYGSAIADVVALLLTFFWQGTVPVALLLAVLPPLTALRNGLPRRYIPRLIPVTALVVAGILYINVNSPIDRLQNNTPAALASVLFLLATGLLLSTITWISQNRRFRSLQSLLLASFVIIVTISTVLTAVLSAMGAYNNSQAQTFRTLEAITTLKLNQIDSLLADSQNDTQTLLEDPSFQTNTLEILAGGGLDSASLEHVKQVVRSRMVDLLGAEEEAYQEIMVLDTGGNVVISTVPHTEGTSLNKEAFFAQGLAELYAGFRKNPASGVEDLIVATPIFDETDQTTRGVLMLRSNAAAMKAILEDTPGFPEAETYLVGLDFKPVTRTRTSAGIISTKAAVDAIRQQVSGARAVYPNYERQQVLGYYQWFPPMQLAVIAEVPQSFVIRSSVASLAGSALLAVLIIVVAVTAVIISARTVSDPIKTLAETTQSLAAGKLSARAIVDRQDEIGALAQAYNQMATQLQEMIGKLEQRVADRTRDLEGQTLRLRVAAEIARDAASARDLRELLARTAELISQRFGFYHTGIFLLDNNREYAVLVASPSEPGQAMMANDHKLRVGEMGIVGRVAAAGEPRVTQNTGGDNVYFNNPYLPNTQSEMSLPLKVENKVIGVLDVQSDKPQAFSDEDVATMQILADQLAIAIERTRLLQEVESNLKELESAYGRFTRQNWDRISRETLIGSRGYRFDNVRIEAINELPELAENAMKTGRTLSSNGRHPGASNASQVAVPIKLRGQTIGVISLKLKAGDDRNTLSIVEQATERLAAAMESARLYEEARLRADREQSISKVTAAISGSTEYEQILQTTIREIGYILGDTEVSIQILEEPAADKRAGRREQ